MHLSRRRRHRRALPLLRAVPARPPLRALPLLLVLLLWVPLSIGTPTVAAHPTAGSLPTSAAASVVAAPTAHQLSPVTGGAHLMAREGAHRSAPAGPDAVVTVVTAGAARQDWTRRTDRRSLIPRHGHDRRGSRAPPSRPVTTD